MKRSTTYKQPIQETSNTPAWNVYTISGDTCGNDRSSESKSSKKSDINRQFDDREWNEITTKVIAERGNLWKRLADL